MKPKTTQPKTPKQRQARDFFQTPNYATDLLIPYFPKVAIWEPACGDGKIVFRLRGHGYNAMGTDIQGFDPSVNFLEDLLAYPFEAIVTNPPFSLKKQFYDRCRNLNVPFALLVPTDFCGWVLRAMLEGAQWIIPTRRIDFITPTGRSGKKSTSQFHSGWLTWRLDLSQQITIVELTTEMKKNI